MMKGDEMSISIFIITILASVLSIGFISNDINESSIKIKNDKTNAYSCYDYKKIKEYGQLYSICNSYDFNNSKFNSTMDFIGFLKNETLTTQILGY